MQNKIVNIDLSSIYIDPKKYQKHEAYFEKYISLCLNDPNIKTIMNDKNISKDDLVEIYYDILKSGAATWAKGHYVPLSSIAYPEPLLMYLDLKKEGKNIIEIGWLLLKYWER